jgi:hypothetical protein
VGECTRYEEEKKKIEDEEEHGRTRRRRSPSPERPKLTRPHAPLSHVQSNQTDRVHFKGPRRQWRQSSLFHEPLVVVGKMDSRRLHVVSCQWISRPLHADVTVAHRTPTPWEAALSQTYFRKAYLQYNNNRTSRTSVEEAVQPRHIPSSFPADTAPNKLTVEVQLFFSAIYRRLQRTFQAAFWLFSSPCGSLTMISMTTFFSPRCR